jgi:hypothetical protein
LSNGHIDQFIEVVGPY